MTMKSGYMEAWKDNVEMSKLGQEVSLDCRSELLKVPEGLVAAAIKLLKSYFSKYKN